MAPTLHTTASIPAEPMAPIDVAWLRMDEPDNLMQINSVLAFDGPCDFERIRARLGERLGHVRRFRQKVVTRGGRFFWENDPDFDLDNHVVPTRLPEPGDHAAAQQLFGELMAEPLDHARPLWKFHVIENFEGGTAVFARIHHAVGDGVAMMLVLLSMCDVEPNGPAAAAVDGQPSGPELADLLGDPASSVAALRGLADDVFPDLMRLLLSPLEAFHRASPVAKAAAVTGGLAKLLAYPPDQRTEFKGKLGVPKRAAWSRALPLDEVKAVSRALGGTLNDGLLSAVGGGLRRYVARRAEPRENLVIRAAVPINLRPLERMSELGNRFGLLFLGIPVGIADPRRRMQELKRRADALKRSAEPLVVLGLLHLFGKVPLPLERLALTIFGSKGTAVMTNVPGPRKVLYFAGFPIEDMFFWVPQSGHMGMGISIFSYRGRVRLGFGTDAGLVPEPAALIDGFYDEWAAMKDLVGRPKSELTHNL